MSIARIDEIEEKAKRQGLSFGISSPASYFAAAALREQSEIEDVGAIDTIKEAGKTTEKDNHTKTNQVASEKEQQVEMPNKDEGSQKALLAQGYFEMLATYNKLSLDLT